MNESSLEKLLFKNNDKISLTISLIENRRPLMQFDIIKTYNNKHYIPIELLLSKLKFKFTNKKDFYEVYINGNIKKLSKSKNHITEKGIIFYDNDLIREAFGFNLKISEENLSAEVFNEQKIVIPLYTELKINNMNLRNLQKKIIKKNYTQRFRGGNYNFEQNINFIKKNTVTKSRLSIGLFKDYSILYKNSYSKKSENIINNQSINSFSLIKENDEYISLIRKSSEFEEFNYEDLMFNQSNFMSRVFNISIQENEQALIYINNSLFLKLKTENFARIEKIELPLFTGPNNVRIEYYNQFGEFREEKFTELLRQNRLVGNKWLKYINYNNNKLANSSNFSFNLNKNFNNKIFNSQLKIDQDINSKNTSLSMSLSSFFNRVEWTTNPQLIFLETKNKENKAKYLFINRFRYNIKNGDLSYINSYSKEVNNNILSYSLMKYNIQNRIQYSSNYTASTRIKNQSFNISNNHKYFNNNVLYNLDNSDYKGSLRVLMYKYLYINFLYTNNLFELDNLFLFFTKTIRNYDMVSFQYKKNFLQDSNSAIVNYRFNQKQYQINLNYEKKWGELIKEEDSLSINISYGISGSSRKNKPYLYNPSMFPKSRLLIRSFVDVDEDGEFDKNIDIPLGNIKYHSTNASDFVTNINGETSGTIRYIPNGLTKIFRITMPNSLYLIPINENFFIKTSQNSINEIYDIFHFRGSINIYVKNKKIKKKDIKIINRTLKKEITNFQKVDDFINLNQLKAGDYEILIQNKSFKKIKLNPDSPAIYLDL